MKLLAVDFALLILAAVCVGCIWRENWKKYKRLRDQQRRLYKGWLPYE
jgi:hypothetical protein